MYKDQILNMLKQHRDDPNCVLGDLVLELLGITSLLRHSLYENTDVYSAGVVIALSDKANYHGDVTIAINNVLSQIEQLISTGHIKMGMSVNVDAFGPKDFMPDIVNNRLTSTSHYTEYYYHISNRKWNMLCSHFLI